MTDIICGVDVSSTHLDARIGRAGAYARFAHTPEGVEALASFCREHGATLVAMEATDGYEKKPFALLWAHGLPCAILNPRMTRRFAEAMGVLEKTDRIDARIIAWCAEAKAVRPTEPASQTQQRLTALVVRLRQLTAVRTAQTNQRRLVDDARVLSSFEEILALVARQIRALEAEIAALIAADPLWRPLDAAFRAIKGVADRTVATLMAELPEIGLISNKAIAKLVGSAPLANDSGGSLGRRAARGGRANVRALLFVVAEIVRRYDPDFADFHRRLQGKPKKVIRVALAHKPLVRLNAKARDARKPSPQLDKPDSRSPAIGRSEERPSLDGLWRVRKGPRPSSPAVKRRGRGTGRRPVEGVLLVVKNSHPRSGNKALSPSGEASAMPRSVMSPVTRRAGVTSKAGLAAFVPSGATLTR